MNPTERQMFDRICAKYSGDAWAVFPQVPDGTGLDKRRTADAVAMSLWPSRGLELHGFEIKVSRADWRKELQQGAKAESIARYCDRWWIVVSDKTIVADGELPPTWGLMVKHGAGLRIVVKAPALDPSPLDRSFIAGLLRAAKKFDELHSDHACELRAARADGEEAGRESERRSNQHRQNHLIELAERVNEFEKASGVSLRHTWIGGAKIGAAVKAVLDMRGGEFGRVTTSVRTNAKKLIDCADRIDAALKESEECDADVNTGESL